MKIMNEGFVKILKLVGSAIVGFASMIIALIGIKKEMDASSEPSYSSKEVYNNGGKVTSIHHMDFDRHTEVHK